MGKEKWHIASKIFVTGGIVLLLALVSFIIWLLQTKFRYEQYRTQLMYAMGGQTAVVEVIGDDGTRCELSDQNRRALYSFLSDSNGRRKQISTVKLTGRSLSFTSSSAVGTAEGTVSETESEYVYVTFSTREQEWKYYIDNRATYEHYAKTFSPEGWMEPNTVLEGAAP